MFTVACELVSYPTGINARQTVRREELEVKELRVGHDYVHHTCVNAVKLRSLRS